jgi:hypothetical protein
MRGMRSLAFLPINSNTFIEKEVRQRGELYTPAMVFLAKMEGGLICGCI